MNAISKFNEILETCTDIEDIPNYLYTLNNEELIQIINKVNIMPWSWNKTKEDYIRQICSSRTVARAYDRLNYDSSPTIQLNYGDIIYEEAMIVTQDKKYYFADCCILSKNIRDFQKLLLNNYIVKAREDIYRVIKPCEVKANIITEPKITRHYIDGRESEEVDIDDIIKESI